MLEKQRSVHETVIGLGRITTKTNIKDTLTQGLNLEHGVVFLQQTFGHFGGDFQLLLNGGQKICFGVLLVCGIEERHLAQLVVTVQREGQRKRTLGGAVLHGRFNGGSGVGQQPGSHGCIKPLCRVQQRQRTLLLKIVHQKILRKLLAVACSQHGQVSLVLGKQK